MAERLLIIEDEETLRDSLSRVLSREGYTVHALGTAEDALKALEKSFYDLVLTDIILPGITGIELLKKIKELLPEQIVVLMTAYASLETAVEALRSGAYDYVVKPVMHEEIKQVVKNALMQGVLQEENTRLRNQMERQYDLNRIIGESPAMQRILGEAKKAAETKSHVFLAGEIGTGKELIARVIHLNSTRANKPFIPVNLRTFSGQQIEAILFGSVKGMLENRTLSRKGLLEEANGGTVFLREIGDLSPDLQAKLLEMLEEQKIMPVGATEPLTVDIRFISASFSDCELALKEKRLIPDFFRKISDVTIALPPLRERKEDIMPLIDLFLRRYATDFCKNAPCFDAEAREYLMSHPWPGNVRELENLIERIILLSENETITTEHLHLRR